MNRRTVTAAAGLAVLTTVLSGCAAMPDLPFLPGGATAPVDRASDTALTAAATKIAAVGGPAGWAARPDKPTAWSPAVAEGAPQTLTPAATTVVQVTAGDEAFSAYAGYTSPSFTATDPASVAGVCTTFADWVMPTIETVGSTVTSTRAFWEADCKAALGAPAEAGTGEERVWFVEPSKTVPNDVWFISGVINGSGAQRTTTVFVGVDHGIYAADAAALLP